MEYWCFSCGNYKYIKFTFKFLMLILFEIAKIQQVTPETAWNLHGTTWDSALRKLLKISFITEMNMFAVGFISLSKILAKFQRWTPFDDIFHSLLATHSYSFDHPNDIFKRLNPPTAKDNIVSFGLLEGWHVYKIKWFFCRNVDVDWYIHKQSTIKVYDDKMLS